MYVPAPSQAGDFELPPAGGPYVAICTRFIDLGTQYSEAYNKSAHKVMIGWELAEMADSQNRPYQIAKRYTWSMHPKAVLRKDLEAWRGSPFTEENFQEGHPQRFNAAKLLGKACQMIISHSDTPDRTYANVAAIMAMGRGMTAPEPISPLEYLALTPGEFDAKLYATLSDGLKRIIEQSPEFAKLGIPKMAGPAQGNGAVRQQQRQVQQQQARAFTAAETAVVGDDELNDEIPF